ncbi:hypothetical protein CTI14_65795, partial [Methylobacterium radiotolerans]
VDNHKMLELLDGLGVAYKSVSSTIEEETVELIKQLLAEEAGADTAGASAAPAVAVDNHKMLELLDGLGVAYKSVSSTIEEETVELI